MAIYINSYYVVATIFHGEYVCSRNGTAKEGTEKKREGGEKKERVRESFDSHSLAVATKSLEEFCASSLVFYTY